MKEVAAKLIELELMLNHLPEANGIPIGSLLSDFWLQIYKQEKGQKIKNTHLVIQVLSVIKYIFLFIFSSKKQNKIPQSADLLLCKSGDKRHHDRLIDYIPKNVKHTELVKSDYKTLYNYLTTLERLRVLNHFLSIIFRVIPKIQKVLVERKLSNMLLNLTLSISLIKFYGAIEYFNKKKIRLVLVDYDRSTFAQIVLAANSQKVKTVSLQHGVINPPYGYIPLLASEIWVWGNLWKDYLIAMGEPADKIRIIGSTIVDGINTPRKIGKLRNVGIGPNPVGDDLNKRMWEPIVVLLMKLGYNVIIKLHPSMDKSRQGERVFGRCSKILNANEISNQDFFQSIDLLVVSNSGLGYEAVMAGTPVAVIKESNSSEANDYIMVNVGGFPEIALDNNIDDNLLLISESLDQIFDLEQRFVREKVFSLTGDDARQITISNLKAL